MKDCSSSSLFRFASMGPFQQFTNLVLCFIIFKSAVSLPTDVLERQSSPLQYFNESLDAQPLHIPASNFLLERDPDEDYRNDLAKGTIYDCRLRDPSLRNDQSPFTSDEQLASSGWVRKDKQLDTDVLQLLEVAFNLLRIPINPDDIVNIKWKHANPGVNGKGDHFIETDGVYESMYSSSAGYIIAVDSWSPKFELEKERKRKPYLPDVLPDVYRWSDITFIEWKTQAGARIKELHYIFQSNIMNQESKMVIERAAGGLNNLQWPGKIFEMASSEGRAILGSPNGRGVAFLLATHKEQLGQRTVERVLVWRAYSQEWGYALFAVFIIDDPPESS